jgi:hypothetical protein
MPGPASAIGAAGVDAARGMGSMCEENAGVTSLLSNFKDRTFCMRSFSSSRASASWFGSGADTRLSQSRCVRPALDGNLPGVWRGWFGAWLTRSLCGRGALPGERSGAVAAASAIRLPIVPVAELCGARRALIPLGSVWSARLRDDIAATKQPASTIDPHVRDGRVHTCCVGLRLRRGVWQTSDGDLYGPVLVGFMFSRVVRVISVFRL